jgi:hypothetical protein
MSEKLGRMEHKALTTGELVTEFIFLPHTAQMVSLEAVPERHHKAY